MINRVAVYDSINKGRLLGYIEMDRPSYVNAGQIFRMPVWPPSWRTIYPQFDAGILADYRCAAEVVDFRVEYGEVESKANQWVNTRKLVLMTSAPLGTLRNVRGFKFPYPNDR
jgi:hypothetical protein